MDGWMDGWMDGQTDGWIDAWTDGWLNKHICTEITYRCNIATDRRYTETQMAYYIFIPWLKQIFSSSQALAEKRQESPSWLHLQKRKSIYENNNTSILLLILSCCYRWIKKFEVFHQEAPQDHFAIFLGSRKYLTLYKVCFCRTLSLTIVCWHTPDPSLSTSTQWAILLLLGSCHTHIIQVLVPNQKVRWPCWAYKFWYIL